MKKMRLVAIGAVVLMLASGAAWAQTEGGMKQRGDGGKGRVMKELNLTAEQEKKFEENRKARHEETMKLREAIKDKHAQLQEALKNPAVTRESVEPLAVQIKALQAQMVDQRLNAIFSAKAILTPEQFAKFQQIADKGKGNKNGHFYRGGKEKSKNDN